MKRTIAASLLLLGLFLPSFAIAQLNPMCISQYALANQACAVLPSQEAPSTRNQTRSQDDGTGDSNGNDDDSDDDDDDDDYVGDGDGNSKGDERERRHKHGKKHKGRKHGKKDGGDHKKEPRANKDCCRWLEELNESCVCGALLRLPPFLVKPKHEYSIKVGNSCRFTYNCYGV